MPRRSCFHAKRFTPDRSYRPCSACSNLFRLDKQAFLLPMQQMRRGVRPVFLASCPATTRDGKETRQMPPVPQRGMGNCHKEKLLALRSFRDRAPRFHRQQFVTRHFAAYFWGSSRHSEYAWSRSQPVRNTWMIPGRQPQLVSARSTSEQRHTPSQPHERHHIAPDA